MYCYRCNGTLDLKKDTCSKCGTDIRMFKKIVYASNRYYNEGLTKAQARDLTGAREALRTSLHLYKHNTDARNLLGLVNYAMGESAEGLKEWVISKNLASGSNMADRFINNMKRSMRDLDSEAHGIRKYNQALNYAKNGAKDLAVIQLKKVVSVHGNMTKAYELLALLYMEDEKYDQAKKVLNQCLQVDHGNTQAIHYLNEIENMDGRGRNNRSMGVVGDDDREQLIIPVRFRDYGTYLANALYILLGLLLGVAIAWFVIVPGKVQKETGDAVAQARSYEAEISALQEQSAAAKRSEENRIIAESVRQSEAESASEKESEETASEEEEKEQSFSLTEYPAKYPSWSKNNAAVPLAANQNGTGEYSDFIRNFLSIDGGQLSDENAELYVQLVQVILNPTNYETYMKKAKSMVKKKNYDDAAVLFDGISLLHPEDALPRYSAASAYENAKDTETAANRYWQVAVLYPGTEEAEKAEKKFLELSGEKKVPEASKKLNIGDYVEPLTYEEFGVEEPAPPETSKEEKESKKTEEKESSENPEGEPAAEESPEGEQPAAEGNPEGGAAPEENPEAEENPAEEASSEG